MKFTFDPDVPSGSVITSASINFYYKTNTAGDTVCWYFETYNGATLLGTHGSTGTPVSCNSTNAFSTDNVTLSELTSVTDANNLTIKVYMKDSTAARKSQMDLVQLNTQLLPRLTRGTPLPGEAFLVASDDNMRSNAA